MKLAAIVDIVPQNKLHPKTQEILGFEQAEYVLAHNVRPETFAPVANAAGIVMTPNDSHLSYAEFFANLGIPVYVEKPVVTNLGDLRRFLALVSRNANLIYGAEYCTDGKGLGMLFASGAINATDPRVRYLKFNPPGITEKEIAAIFRSLGKVRKIEGTMLEGGGAAGTADHRPWLLDGIHAGMIRDLASHLFGPLYDISLASSTVVEPKVALGRYEHGEAPGTFRKLKSAEEGETYALLEGKFSTTSGIIQFHFEVGKYWPKHNRKLELFFENGYAALSYEKPFEFRIESANEAPVIITLEIEHYPTLALLDFKSFMRGQNDGHVGRAAAIVKFNETMRTVGIRNL